MKNRMRIGATVAAVLALSIGTAVSADGPSLDDKFATEFARSGLTAAGFGVQQSDRPPEIMVAGTTARSSSAPVPADAAWHIGSITKTFTATLIMMAVADDQLSLDAPLASMLPDQAGSMDASWQDITLREILSHTAGLPANPTYRQMLAARTGRLNTDAALAAHWGSPLRGKRGQFGYSNLGYILAGRIYEEATGVAWEKALRDRIIAPLGLTSFGMGPPDVIRGHHATFGIVRRPADPKASSSDNPEIFDPAGRMHMSIADMLKWGRFLLDACAGRSTLLSAEACQDMIAPVTDGYGLGIARFEITGVTDTALGHDGSNTLWFAILAMIPEHDMVAFVAASEARSEQVSRLAISMLQAVQAR